MKRTVQVTGLVISLLYGASIAWLYARQPRSFEELKTQAAIEANVYRVKQENFDEAMKYFDAGNYKVAITQFELADPARLDARTQFYIAYCYYKLGRGRVFDDDAMFRKALEVVERCLAVAPNNIYQSDRADLEIPSASALRQRLKEGLEVSGSDFNPFTWFDKK